MDKGKIEQILEEWNVCSCDNSALADRLLEEFSPEGEYIKKADMERILYSTNNAVRIGELFTELPTYTIPNSAEINGEWIPVTERLPENNTEVVYCSEMGTVGSCHYFEGFNHYPGCSGEDIFDDVVAWLPIPEVPLEKGWWNAPYKAESEE